MNSYLFFIPFLLLTALTSVTFSATTPASPELIIYTYDSFMAHGGPGPEIFPLFEKRYKCKVRALPSGDGGQILTRLQLDAERKKPTAHLVLGIDQQIWERAKQWLEPWDSWTPKGYSKIINTLKVENGFLPYDHGVFALIADMQAIKKHKVPQNLNDLLKPEWKRNIILEDPRTSTPGLAFLLFAKEVLKDGVWEFWNKFRTQWLTLTPGWDQAYGLFLKGEAPLVWSYTTSQAYHVENGDTEGRYKAILFEEGQPVQIEGAALVKGVVQRELAKSFLEFLLLPEVQGIIAKRNWMLPVIKNISLPPSFTKLPQPKKLYRIQLGAKETEQILKEWNQVVTGS